MSHGLGGGGALCLQSLQSQRFPIKLVVRPKRVFKKRFTAGLFVSSHTCRGASDMTEADLEWNRLQLVIYRQRL